MHCKAKSVTSASTLHEGQINRWSGLKTFIHFVVAIGSVAWTIFFDRITGNAWLSPIAIAVALAPILVVLGAPHLSRIGSPRIRSARVRARMLLRRRTEYQLSVGRSVCWCALIISVIVLRVEWHPQKTFLRHLWSVREGMSVDDVEFIMGRYMKGAGASWHLPEFDPLVRGAEPVGAEVEGQHARSIPYRQPSYGHGENRRRFSGVMIYRWSTEAKFNADWGHITFAEGVVVKVKFYGD
jgi:hypothetical protein